VASRGDAVPAQEVVDIHREAALPGPLAVLNCPTRSQGGDSRMDTAAWIA
jgi:hypothetical protein